MLCFFGFPNKNVYLTQMQGWVNLLKYLIPSLYNRHGYFNEKYV